MKALTACVLVLLAAEGAAQELIAEQVDAANIALWQRATWFAANGDLHRSDGTRAGTRMLAGSVEAIQTSPDVLWSQHRPSLRTVLGWDADGSTVFNAYQLLPPEFRMAHTSPSAEPRYFASSQLLGRPVVIDARIINEYGDARYEIHAAPWEQSVRQDYRWVGDAYVVHAETDSIVTGDVWTYYHNLATGEVIHDHLDGGILATRTRLGLWIQGFDGNYRHTLVPEPGQRAYSFGSFYGDPTILGEAGESIWYLDSGPTTTLESSPPIGSPVTIRVPLRPYAIALLGPNLLVALGDNARLYRITLDGSSPAQIADLGAMSQIGDFVEAGPLAYFPVEISSGNFALYRTDGTPSGTMCLVDGLTALPEPILSVHDAGVLFRGEDGANGSEPWISDGTVANTRILADLNPAAASADPRELRIHDDVTALFLAEDGTVQDGLFAVDLAEFEWIRSPVSGHWYRLTEPATWEFAQARARNLGGHLATIRSAAEQDWIWQTFGPGDLWIGLHDLDQNGSYEWISGETETFRNWCTGEPDGWMTGEYVVHLSDDPGCPGAWKDRSPTARLRGVVERVARPRAFEPIGVGCAGNNSLGTGDPASITYSSGVPEPGSTVTLDVDAAIDADLSGFLIIGVNDQEWSGLQLPLELTPLGMPGCALYVRVDDLVGISLTGGRTTIPVTIPDNEGLEGSAVFLQAVVLDPASNPLGALTSNAVRVTVL